jgi:hypothetical protein
LLLLELRNNQPDDFAGAVPSIIFAFHRRHHLKYDDLIDLPHNFQLFAKWPFPGSDEIVENNRCFNNLQKCMKLENKHTLLR